MRTLLETELVRLAYHSASQGMLEKLREFAANFHQFDNYKQDTHIYAYSAMPGQLAISATAWVAFNYEGA